MKKNNAEIVFETGQEQAVASWINYLNALRMERLAEALSEIDDKYDVKGAIKILDSTMKQIEKGIIERNRGGQKGMHGFIAECAEVGVNNAWLKYENKIPVYKWINDNGPADIMKGTIEIQQKFYNSGLSLDAVKAHHEAYPDFLKMGKKYQIPKDQLEQIKYLLGIPEDVANKMPTSDGTFSMKQWRKVHDFFGKDGFKLDDFEEAKLDYKSVQRNTIGKTIAKEKDKIKQANRELKDSARLKSRPTLDEGLKTTAASAVIEGGAAFSMAIVRKLKSGKHLNDFGLDDWEEIIKETGIGTVKGGVRGASIYALTNLKIAPAAVASSIVTASFSIADQANMLRKGNISEEDFIYNSQVVCLDVSVSALSSLIGQTVIPIPVLGAVIGNTVGTMMYQIAKDNLSRYEQKLVLQYMHEIEEVNKTLDTQYRVFVKDLVKELQIYYKLLDSAFSPDYRMAFEGSVSLAENVGVPHQRILKNRSEIDDYFLN